MALAVILGPRLGKYAGWATAFPAHNIVFVVTDLHPCCLMDGVQSGFDARRDGPADRRGAINTNSRRWAGSATAMVLWYFMFGKPDISLACNGMLAGLVAITALRLRRSQCAAVIIGIIAGAIVCCGVPFNDRVLKVDDPCGAISVHGFCGWFAQSPSGFCHGTYGAGRNGVGRRPTSACLARASPVCSMAIRRSSSRSLGAPRLRRVCVWRHSSCSRP
jgi:Amt family ammonium transporter